MDHGVDDGRSAWGVIRSDVAAVWAFRAACAAALPLYFVFGRHQWFVRDDWDLLIGREHILRSRGWQHWLFDAQAGHWLTVPVLVFHQAERWFGLGSYWPFLVPAMAAHFAAVLLARNLCRRSGVSAWSTTLVSTLLLVFGAGWENMIFAVQISFNLSLVAFLAQLVLTDHVGPVNRRDVLAAGIALVGLASSGFGPIFIFGVFVHLVLRRRWTAVMVVVVPQVVVYGWWFVFWEADSAARPGNQSQLPTFVVHGITTLFDGLAGVSGVAGLVVLGVLVTLLARSFPARVRSLFLALGSTMVVMYGAIAFERVGLDPTLATSSRYTYMAAFVIAPVFAMSVDRLGQLSPTLRRVGLVLVFASIALNLSTLDRLSVEWSQQTSSQRETFELVAGSWLASSAVDDRPFFPESAAVRPSVLAELVRRGALDPRTLVTPGEFQLARQALGLAGP